MKAEARKKFILECAKTLFSQKGFYDTQISDIIDEAKIARGTVYQYFKNKDDIFITLIKNYYNDWEDFISLTKDDIDLKTITPQDYFRHRIRKTLLFLSADPDLCNIILRMGVGLSGDLETVVRRFEKKILNIIVDDLNLGIRNNHINKNLNINLVSNLLTGALLKVAQHYFAGKKGKFTQQKIDEMTEEIFDVFAPSLFL